MRSRGLELARLSAVASDIGRTLMCILLLCTASLTFAQKEEKSSPPLDLNSATVEQLEKLPEIGPITAKAIVRFREKSGPFRRVEDLLAIRGITKRRLEKLRPLVIVKPKPS